MLEWLGVVRELADNPSKRRRMRGRRLTMYSTYPSDPRETSGLRMDRIQPVQPPLPVEARRPRIKKKVFLFGPQYVSHRSLWTISEPKDTQTAACAVLASVLPVSTGARRLCCGEDLEEKDL